MDLTVGGGNCAPICSRYYFYGDHLGSANVMSDGTTLNNDSDYFPFGGERIARTSNVNPHYKFTGKEIDPEDNLLHFFARDYSSRLGRFMSPDPLAGDITNPQSLNRYAYVLNNPLNFVDPLGLVDDPCANDPSCVTSYGGGGSDVPLDFELCATLLICGPGIPSPFQPIPDPNGGDNGGATTPTTPPVSPANNRNPIAPADPCQFAGRALLPSAYAQAGKAANGSPINFVLDVTMGFPRGHFLDAQPLATGNPLQKEAYGNYAFGVYMQAAGVPLSTALSGANAYAFFSGAKYNPNKNGPMDPNFGLLPAANIANITNGYSAQANGTTCHN